MDAPYLRIPMPAYLHAKLADIGAAEGVVPEAVVVEAATAWCELTAGERRRISDVAYRRIGHREGGR